MSMSADDTNLNENVSRFNIEWYLFLCPSDNDDRNDILMQINMSVPHENPESRRCVLVAFTCLHVCTFMVVAH